MVEAGDTPSLFAIGLNLCAIVALTVLFQCFAKDYFLYLNISSYFAFSWDFVHYLDPLRIAARWLSAFHICWFGIPLLGATLTAIAVWTGTWLAWKTLLTLVKKNPLTSNIYFKILFFTLFILGFAWLLVRPVNYFDVAFSIFAMMALFILWTKFSSNAIKWITGIAFLILAYLGFGAYVYGLCCLMILFLVTNTGKNQTRGKANSFVLSLVLLLTTAVIPFIAHKTIYLRLLKDTYLAGFKSELLWAKPTFSPWAFQEQERLFYRTQVLAFNEDWETMKTELSDYFDRINFEEHVTRFNEDLLNYYKLSTILTLSLGEADYTKRLDQHVFSFLYALPLEGGNGTPSFFYSDLFYQTGGAVTFARCWVMTSMHGNGLSRRNVQRMAECNAVLQDSDFADKYDFLIDDYPFAFRMDSAKLAFRRSLLAQHDQVYFTSSMDFRLLALLENCPNNRYVLEFTVFCALQYQRQHHFVLAMLENFHRLGYTQLSPFFEQALLAARFTDSTTNAELFPVSEQTQQRYANYTADQAKLSQGLISFVAFRKKYIDTYWFSFDYLEPFPFSY